LLLPITSSGASSPAFSTAAKAALLAVALAPSSQTIGNASSAVLACHQVSATTASARSPTVTVSTFFTPGRLAMAAASKLLTLPPNTGQSLMAALSMPGSFRSMPQTCAPVNLSWMSRRITGLPMSFQSFGSFSGTLAGGVSLAAASATLPKLVLRPDGPWVMPQFAARHSLTGTFHSSAAACNSISRAVAPPLRTYSCDSRMRRHCPGSCAA
jgi:hypothetical protein